MKRIVRRAAAGARSARFWRVLFVALLLAITLLALFPMPPHAPSAGWDKLNHVCAFVALTVSGRLGHAGSTSKHVVLLVALLAYGGLIEIVQMFVPNREAQWGDLLADAIGVAGGALLAVALQRVTRAPAGARADANAP